MGKKTARALADGEIVYKKVGGEYRHKYPLQAALAQIAGEARRRAAVIFIERGVGIDFGTKTLADNQLRPCCLQPRMKRRPRAALDAVIRPERLLAVGHIDGFKGRRAGM